VLPSWAEGLPSCHEVRLRSLPHRYSIADEKVRQRILRIRCKTCSNVITVQAGEVVAGRRIPRSGRSPVFGQLCIGRAPLIKAFASPSGLHEWFVAVDGVEQGPLSCADAAKYIVSRKPEQSVHVWKEGMDGWKAPKDVAIIAQEISELSGRRSDHRHTRRPRRATPTRRPRLARLSAGRCGAWVAGFRLQTQASAGWRLWL